jgi:hypothetical protein
MTICTNSSQPLNPVRTPLCDHCETHYSEPTALLRSALIDALRSGGWVLMFADRFHVCPVCAEAAGYFEPGAGAKVTASAF